MRKSTLLTDALSGSLLRHASNPITKVLAVEAEKLRQQWLDFRKQNSKEDQLEVKNYEPTIAGVFSMASANHETIAEELSQALTTISEHVAACDIEMELFKTEEMQSAIADLYAHIFLFLNDTLAWFTKKCHRRLLDSMNEKFLQRFEAEIENIVRKSERIKRKAAQMSMAEQRVTRLTLEESSKDLRVGLEGILRENAETKYYARQFADQFEMQRKERREERANNALLYESLIKLLTDAAESNRERVPSLAIEGSPNSKRRSLIGTLCGENVIANRDQLLLDSAVLEDFLHRDRVQLDPSLFGETPTFSDAVSALAEWTKDFASPRMLCISSNDFSGNDFNAPQSMLAAQFIDFASVSKVPVISYFCEIRRREKLRGNNSPEVQGFVSLVYGLLRQMIELLPMEFETSRDFSKERFAELDGTLLTWGVFKGLFRDVQSVLPGKVYCVIDGVQWLDDSSTSICMTELVDLLRLENLKVLFTTSGSSRSLLENLEREELHLLGGRSAESSSLWQLEEGLLERV
ncbi:uncharacterized protein N0V89_003615 [Didymosphaeria variabile]|uniref:DUF7708 domain-containing protein n=1 Tax=Didymosphaeria variabile TaxID=1932322 RepID=A0A9W8XQW2_9PLEO|nr:uncharacterized protein N0V89_003615 [Didymosphaeria variabile]KAJ4355595.1 hypothetical protein N0V89_003615 [Didymosphaeria variabile]